MGALTLSDRFNALGGRVPMRNLAAGDCAWLTEALIPTDAARERLRRWAAAGCLAPDHDALNVLHSDAREVIEDACRRLPDCVADHLVRNVYVAVVGRESGGWVTSLPALPSATEAPQILVVQASDDDAETAGVFAHEAAHAWLSLKIYDHADLVSTVPARRDTAALVDRLAKAWALPSPQIGRAREEWRVARLAGSWGFSGWACDAGRLGRDLQRARRLQSPTQE